MAIELRHYWNQIDQAYLQDQDSLIEHFVSYLAEYDSQNIMGQARQWAVAIRAEKNRQSTVDAFLHEYQLNSEEGLVLMGIAEALLRIPDPATQDLFLQEKLTTADWHKHLQHSDSLLVNFSTRALDITGKFEQHQDLADQHNQHIFTRIVSRIGVPLVRTALKQAMQKLAFQFVIAETIENAVAHSQQHPDYLYSFDMLGEAAVTESDAEDYLHAYVQAIDYLARQPKKPQLHDNPSISIKLSALCPRYEPLQHEQAVTQLSIRLLELAKQARAAGISLTVDAEETERLEMSLQIFLNVISDPAIIGWSGLGLAVQAYQKRAFNTLKWLYHLAKALQCKIPLRLVKGAYWDSEIKRAQVNGLADYPVFTHKTATDIAYLACARFLMMHPQFFYPQFASHNAHTLAAIQVMAKNHPGYEFQRLHGMGEALHQQVQITTAQKTPCRIYAPVGQYNALLPYLVRRLLENGANTSFINQLENPQISIEKVISDPLEDLKTKSLQSNIVLPKDLFGKKRLNSEGINLNSLTEICHIQQALNQFKKRTWNAAPIINGEIYAGNEYKRYNPAHPEQPVGCSYCCQNDAIADAIQSASMAFTNWRLLAVQQRAERLLKTAELMEQNRTELLALCVQEAGKTIKDALAEIREAVDFCRYYVQLALDSFAQPTALDGPTGEGNKLYQYGRGVFVCISPWNFPIAIFMGQIAAALVSGNTVIAKPATQTSLLAMRCVQLLHQAGIPVEVLQFLPGDGSRIGQYLLADERIAGVAFTGSTQTAQRINQQLAKHQQIIPLIAETGGQNVMLADSSAYTEQLVHDAVESAFNSAGQRCSALRVLYLPVKVADHIIDKIIGVIKRLQVGDPQQPQTDIGPLIDKQAVQKLADHVEAMRENAKVLFQLELNAENSSPCFFPPTLIELSSLSQLEQENFGPVLHIIRYTAADLPQVIKDINETGYGLTLGIHSRINKNIDDIVKNVKVGNVYINRNMISAVVGVQPFGGMGLSGTGPKAGGPHYLQRFTIEQVVTTNTAAIGGNASLLTRRMS